MKIGTRDMKSSLLRFLMVSVVLVSVGFSAAVQAIPITGSINMGGSAATDNSDVTLAKAFTSFGSTTPVTVTSGTGAYFDLPAETTVLWTPFIFKPANGSTPVIPLWTFTIGSVTYSFDLHSLTGYFSGESGGVSFLGLFGNGTASISGGTYDTTFGDWSLNDTSTDVSTFSFSSVTTVPDGGTSVILLGIALSSLGFLRSLSKHVA